MKCEEARDLILTDYLDGTISDEKKRELQAHMKKCGQCREFESAARKTAVEPFNEAERVTVPDSLWHRIKGNIEQEEYESTQSPASDFLEKLKNLIASPIPAFAVATAMSIVLAVAIISKFDFRDNKVAVNEYLEDQIAFLASLGEDEVNGNSDYFNLGTSLEEYLL